MYICIRKIKSYVFPGVPQTWHSQTANPASALFPSTLWNLVPSCCPHPHLRGAVTHSHVRACLISAICRGIADSAQVIYPQSRSAAKEDLLFLYLVFHSRVLVVVNWSCSSGSKSFCAHYFIFNYVLKPLFSKLTLFWPGEWNKKKVDCKHNTEPKFGQLRAALYSPLKAMCCNKDPTYLHPCKAGQIPGECKCPQGGCSCLWG